MWWPLPPIKVESVRIKSSDFISLIFVCMFPLKIISAISTCLDYSNFIVEPYSLMVKFSTIVTLYLMKTLLFNCEFKTACLCATKPSILVEERIKFDSKTRLKKPVSTFELFFSYNTFLRWSVKPMYELSTNRVAWLRMKPWVRNFASLSTMWQLSNKI